MHKKSPQTLLIDKHETIWDTILSEAENKIRYKLHQPIKHYLISILYNHMTDPTITNYISLSQGMLDRQAQPFSLMKQNADLCLLQAGLWPNHEDMAFLKDYGKYSYEGLARFCKTNQPNLSRLYQSISCDIDIITHIMHAIR